MDNEVADMPYDRSLRGAPGASTHFNFKYHEMLGNRPPVSYWTLILPRQTHIHSIEVAALTTAHGLLRILSRALVTPAKSSSLSVSSHSLCVVFFPSGVYIISWKLDCQPCLGHPTRNSQLTRLFPNPSESSHDSLCL
jgi:hypothetical protein